jgi:hypothetical protein
MGQELVEADAAAEPIEPPREGTLAWLQQQPHVDILGLSLPTCHRIPEGSSLAEANGHCRVIKLSGERCAAPATRHYGICLVHAGGGGGVDYQAMSQAGHAAKIRLKQQRTLLGIGANRVGTARQRARVQAAARAADVAEALLAPLDDEQLGSMLKQAAAVKILDATEPLQTSTVEVELPAEGAGIEALSWVEMQALAAKLLED